MATTLTINGTKTCTNCNVDKPLDQYWSQTKTKDGKRSCCSSCTSAKKREYRAANKELLNEYSRTYNKTNWDYLKEKQKEYRKHKSMEARKQKDLALKTTYCNLIGKQINNLTVISVVPRENHPGYVLKCLCSCGSETVKSKDNLLKKQPLGCPSCTRSLSHKKFLLPNNQSAYNQFLSSYKRGAKNRNLEFNLSNEQFSNLIYSNCHYCNKKPLQIVKCKKSQIVVNGIDRKNNDLGYTIENSVTCCGTCNRVKHVLSYEQFIELIQTISRNLGLK